MRRENAAARTKVDVRWSGGLRSEVGRESFVYHGGKLELYSGVDR